MAARCRFPRRTPPFPNPSPSCMRDYGAGALHPAGCEVMRPIGPHHVNGVRGLDLRNNGDGNWANPAREKSPRRGGMPGLMNGPGGTIMQEGDASRWFHPSRTPGPTGRAPGPPAASRAPSTGPCEPNHLDDFDGTAALTGRKDSREELKEHDLRFDTLPEPVCRTADRNE
jgi:hypothetical protein